MTDPDPKLGRWGWWGWSSMTCRPAALAVPLATWLLLGACAAPSTTSREPTPTFGTLPRTRAELSNYTQTSSHEDVMEFIKQLKLARVPLSYGAIGTTTEGKAIPYLIASRPLVSSPAEAYRLRRPIVYIQGNIHGGEVEGKEVLLAMMRDLAVSPQPNVLDSLVIIAVPIYNADGNDKWGPQEINRTDQNGPTNIGQRANAQGFDLNRDYVKGEAPETRSAIRMFNEWHPDVFVDLHTTNGSYHGYSVTYSGPLTPAAATTAFTRDSVLPALRKRMKERHGIETFDYGDFISQDTLTKGWTTFGAGARYATNYAGMRNMISILSEAYSHDPFDKRVASTRAFVTEIFSLMAKMGRKTFQAVGPIPIQSELTKKPISADVIAERVVKTGDSSRTQAGLPLGLRRTGEYLTVRMPVYDRFDATLTVTRPYAYLIPSHGALINRLAMHGILVEEVPDGWEGEVETIVIDSVHRAERVYQGHNPVTVKAHVIESVQKIPRGVLIVRTDQPLGNLAVYLLDPRSEDGFTTWNLFDAWLFPGTEFPIRRVFKPTLP